jgi:hypothetical protein
MYWNYRGLPISWGLAKWRRIGGTMATVDKAGTGTLQELMVSSLTQTDALCELLIDKGLITEVEFMEKLKAERATYQKMFRQKGN